MELDWSTFILEILNFLILVWLLKRFLYRPVLDVIARRRQGVEDTLRQAHDTRAQAEALEAQYRDRLADWEQEKTAARAQLDQELAAERSRRLARLGEELEQERHKARVLEARRLEELGHHKEAAAFLLAGRFLRHLLERVADPDLEDKLIAITLEDLETLPPERLAALKERAAHTPEVVQVTSAHPLDPASRTRIRECLDRLLGSPHDYAFQQAPELLAGLRVSLGPWVVRANLGEDFELFQEAGRETP